MIRQALATSATGFAGRNEERNSHATKTNLVSNLSRLFGILLPHVFKEETNKIATTLITTAVDLKVELSTAQAVYSCYWVNYEDQFNEAAMVVSAGTMQGGTGSSSGKLCLFPGLTRVMEGASQRAVVVKANITLGTSSSRSSRLGSWIS